MEKKAPKRVIAVGDRVKVNLHHGKLERVERSLLVLIGRVCCLLGDAATSTF